MILQVTQNNTEVHFTGLLVLWVQISDKKLSVTKKMNIFWFWIWIQTNYPSKALSSAVTPYY